MADIDVALEGKSEGPNPMLDETANQHAADIQVVMGHLGEQRMILAVLKLTYFLRRAGVPVKTEYSGDDHRILDLLQRDIEKKRFEVDKLMVILEDLGNEGVIPEPSPIQLARAVPNGKSR